MKIHACFILVLSVIQSYSFGQNCEPELTKEYIDKCDVIFIGEVNYIASDLIFCNALEVFKENIPAKLAVQNMYLFCNTSAFEMNEEYLIYAQFDGKRLVIKDCSRTNLAALRTDDLPLLRQLPCFKEINPEDATRMCTRDLNPVCDCNGESYGNLCEAKKQGVIRYKNCK